METIIKTEQLKIQLTIKMCVFFFVFFYHVWNTQFHHWIEAINGRLLWLENDFLDIFK